MGRVHAHRGSSLSARAAGRRSLLGLAGAAVLVLGWLGPAGSSTIAVICRFTITREGQPLLDDTFSGPYASVGTPRPVADGTTGYAIVGAIPDGSAVNGKLSLSSANGSLSATADGHGRRLTGARLMTNSDPRNTSAGLKRGSVFSMSGLFDFVVPGGPVEGYGIRFTDAGGPHKASNVVSLFVYRDEASSLVLRFLHQDFAAGRQFVVAAPAIDAGAGDQILLVLSHEGRQSDEVTAHYRFWRHGAPVSDTITLPGRARVFGGRERSWTNGAFVTFEMAGR